MPWYKKDIPLTVFSVVAAIGLVWLFTASQLVYKLSSWQHAGKASFVLVELIYFVLFAAAVVILFIQELRQCRPPGFDWRIFLIYTTPGLLGLAFGLYLAYIVKPTHPGFYYPTWFGLIVGGRVKHIFGTLLGVGIVRAAISGSRNLRAEKGE